jgi:hypothetical protein
VIATEIAAVGVSIFGLHYAVFRFGDGIVFSIAHSDVCHHSSILVKSCNQ